MIRQPGCLVHQVSGGQSPPGRGTGTTEQRVERAHLDADPAVHAQRPVDREPVEHEAPPARGRAAAGAGRTESTVSAWPSMSMHQSGHSRTQSMHTVQLLSSRAMTPRLLSGTLSAGTWLAGSLVGGSLSRRDSGGRQPPAGSTAGIVRLHGSRPGPRRASHQRLGLAQRVTLEAVREQQRPRVRVSLEHTPNISMTSRSCQAAPANTPVAVARTGAVRVQGRTQDHASRSSIDHSRATTTGVICSPGRPSS